MKMPIVNATSVIENVTPAIVTIEEAIVDKTERAPSTLTTVDKPLNRKIIIGNMMVQFNEAKS